MSGRGALLGFFDDALGGASDQLLQMVELGAEAADALRDRVALRERAGQDASEAGLPVLAQQLDRGDALDADELPDAIVIDTSQQVDPRVLSAALGLGKLPPG